jgi:hypothetical protein
LNVVVGSPTNGLQLIISTSTNSFRAGQTIDLIVAEKNISTNTAMIRMANNLMYLSFDIVGADGKQLLPTETGKYLMSGQSLFNRASEEVAPGQTVDLSIPLSTLYEVTNTGSYTINVALNVIDHQKISAGPLKISVIEAPK